MTGEKLADMVRRNPGSAWLWMCAARMDVHARMLAEGGRIVIRMTGWVLYAAAKMLTAPVFAIAAVWLLCRIGAEEPAELERLAAELVDAFENADE